MIQGSHSISAKSFCKHSQVKFMPYRVVLKDEHRTSNVEWPILFLHPFPFNIRCWTFDVRCSSFFSKPSTVSRHKNNSALMGSPPLA